MKRAGALLITLAAFAATATPASARMLSESTAYSVADAQAQAIADRAAWTDWYDDACRRDSPWRYTCTLWIGDDQADAYQGWECWRNVDVVSPLWGTRLRLENWTSSSCARNG